MGNIRLNSCLWRIKKERDIPGCPAYHQLYQANLGLANSEHLGPTSRAYALGGRLAVLHGYGFGVLYLLLGTAFHTITLHIQASSFRSIILRLNLLSTKVNVYPSPFWTKKGLRICHPQPFPLLVLYQRHLIKILADCGTASTERPGYLCSG